MTKNSATADAHTVENGDAGTFFGACLISPPRSYLDIETTGLRARLVGLYRNGQMTSLRFDARYYTRESSSITFFGSGSNILFEQTP